MKKAFCLLLVLLILSVSLTAYATTDPVVDMAGLLTDAQAQQLTQLLAAHGDGTLCVVTLDSLDGAYVEDYAENYAESHEAGSGQTAAVPAASFRLYFLRSSFT